MQLKNIIQELHITYIYMCVCILYFLVVLQNIIQLRKNMMPSEIIQIKFDNIINIYYIKLYY